MASEQSSYSQRQNLSERYQLAENIRTLRQLSPVMLIHLVGSLVLAVLAFVAYYRLVGEDVLEAGITDVLAFCDTSAMNLLMQMVIIKQAY